MQVAVKRLKASLWMLFGLVFVFSLVILMNDKGGIIEPKKRNDSMNFVAKKIVKPKPKPKPKPKKKPERSKPKRTASAPSIDSSLSGIDTGLDAFMSDDMNMENDLLGEVDKNVVMSEDSVDVAPSATERSAMVYPRAARKSGITGYVVMNLLISKGGDVEKVKVLESQPANVFDEVAINGVKTWHFEPAKYKGQSVKVWAKQKIRFDLD